MRTTSHEECFDFGSTAVFFSESSAEAWGQLHCLEFSGPRNWFLEKASSLGTQSKQHVAERQATSSHESRS